MNLYWICRGEGGERVQCIQTENICQPHILYSTMFGNAHFKYSHGMENGTDFFVVSLDSVTPHKRKPMCFCCAEMEFYHANNLQSMIALADRTIFFIFVFMKKMKKKTESCEVFVNGTTTTMGESQTERRRKKKANEKKEMLFTF